MKHTNQCPKCGSSEILIEKGNLSDSNSIRIGGSVFFARMPMIHTICADCGYVEMWVDSEDIQFIKKEKQKRDNRDTFWK